MATVNFSVPDEVKASFDKAFSGQNKSAVIAELMRRAVAEAEQRKRREQLFKQLSAGRARRATATARDIQTARAAGRS
jgi:metal-responsive CopG/Arc/MetJ family transcriptional regulator